jgi:hypothetical protein
MPLVYFLELFLYINQAEKISQKYWWASLVARGANSMGVADSEQWVTQGKKKEIRCAPLFLVDDLEREK